MQSADSLHPRALLAQDPARARRLLLEAFGVALRLSLVLMVGWHLNENAQAGRNVVRLWLLPLVDGYPLAGYAPGPLVWWLQPWVEGAALLWVATWYLGLLRRERFKYSFVSTFPRLLLPGYNLVASWPWLDAFAVALERAGGRRRGSRALALVAKAMVVVTALDLIGTLGSYLVRPDLPGWLRVLSTPAGDLALGLQLLFVFGVALLLPRPIRAAPSVEAAAGGAPGAEREDPLSAAVARGQSLPCPRCSPVSALHAPGFAVGPGGSGERVCPTCSGAAIPSAAYEVMLARLHLGPKQLKARQPLPSLPCPCCGQAMASVTIRHGDVYRCRGCGLAWVDGTLIAERRIQPALWAPANGGAGAAPAAGVGDRVAALVLLAVFGAAAVLVAVQQIQTCPALTRADARPLDDGTRVELICVRNKDKAAEGDRWVLDHSGHRVSRTEWGLGYKHGRHEEWTDHGRRLSRRGQYAKGLEDGLWSSWDDEGRLVREERFKAGKPDGRYVEYAHDGTIKLQGNYLAGKKDGLWKTLGDDGKVTLALFDAGADVQLVGSDSEGGTDGGSGDRATAPNPARPSPLKEDLQTGRFGGRQLSWWESRLRELAGRTDAKSARLGELMRHRLSTMGLTVEQGAEAGALKIVAVTAAPAAPSNAAAAAPAARPPPDVGAPPPGSTEVAP